MVSCKYHQSQIVTQVDYYVEPNGAAKQNSENKAEKEVLHLDNSDFTTRHRLYG